MSFKDLLDKYKNGTASEEEKKLIEEELHKHEAIEEYLSESYDIGFERETLQENINSETTFVKRSVNKKLRKVILVSVAIVFLILFGTYYVVSPIVSSFYYNPSQKTVGKYNEDLFYDLRVFTELNLPGYAITGAGSENLGFGVHDIYFQRKNLFNGEAKDITAKIKRDTRIGTWQDFFAKDYLGFMDIRFSNPNPQKNQFIEKSNEEVISHIKKLNPVSYISSNVIFKKDLSVSEFEELRKKYSDKVSFKWAGVRTKSKDDPYSYLSGFNPNFNDGLVTGDSADKNKYPYLELVDYISDEGNRKKFNGSFVEAYTKHFTSLLRYMNNRQKSVKVLDSSPVKAEYYKNALNYVEKNGINIYGVLIYSEAGELLEFINNENIESIEINNVLPSKYIN